MKASRLLIENTLGIRYLDLNMTSPITMVCGSNGAGKSSLQESISMALRGQPLRFDPAKKDMGMLVAEGAKSGAVSLWLDDQRTCSFALPSAEHQQPLLNDAELDYLPYLLDMTRFSRATEDERRKLLFALTGCAVTPEIVGKRLLDKGADPEKVEAVKPLLLSGFPAACKEAKARATEAKGAWRATTGETYGVQKAEGWQPASPEHQVSQEEIAIAERNLQTLEAETEAAQLNARAAESAVKDAEANRQKLDKLRDLEALTSRRQSKLDTDQKALEEWKQKLANAQSEVEKLSRYELLNRLAYAAKMYLERHPNNNQDAMRLESVLSDYVSQHGEPRKADGSGDPELAKREQEFAGYVAQYERAIANDRRDLEESIKAEEEADRIRAALNSIFPGALERLKEDAESRVNKRNQLRNELADLRVAALQTKAHLEAGQKAQAHHTDVKDWTLIANLLAPDALPTELLAIALEPVNKTLMELSVQAGWKVTRIEADMSARADNRLYELLSESEQWRCNALIALAIAKLSGIKLVVLDRFDVLDLPSRRQLLGMLIKQSRTGTIDSVILCGTLKEAPAIKVAEIQVVWMERGSIAAPVEQREAA